MTSGTGTIPVIKLLALNGLLTAIMSCGAYVIMSIPMVIYASISWGIVGSSWAVLAASILVVPLNYFFLASTLRITWVDLLRILWRPTVGAGIMWLVVSWLTPIMDLGSGFGARLVSLLLLIASGAVTYSGAVAILWILMKCPDGAERHIWGQVLRRLRPRA